MMSVSRLRTFCVKTKDEGWRVCIARTGVLFQILLFARWNMKQPTCSIVLKNVCWMMCQTVAVCATKHLVCWTVELKYVKPSTWIRISELRKTANRKQIDNCGLHALQYNCLKIIDTLGILRKIITKFILELQSSDVIGLHRWSVKPRAWVSFRALPSDRLSWFFYGFLPMAKWTSRQVDLTRNKH